MVSGWHNFTPFLHNNNWFIRVNLFNVNFQIISLNMGLGAIWTNKGSHSSVSQASIEMESFSQTLNIHNWEVFIFKDNLTHPWKAKKINGDGTVESCSFVFFYFICWIVYKIINFKHSVHLGWSSWGTLCLTKSFSCSLGTLCWLTRCLTKVFFIFESLIAELRLVIGMMNREFFKTWKVR